MLNPQRRMPGLGGFTCSHSLHPSDAVFPIAAASVEPAAALPEIASPMMFKFLLTLSPTLM
jgi:hypothetical protein